MHFPIMTATTLVLIILAVGTVSGRIVRPSKKLQDLGDGGCVCGQLNRVPKIIGGSPTPVNKYPWMAGLVDGRRVRSGSRVKEPFCGATLLNRNHVITAAHCVLGKNNGDVRVVLGDHDWTTDTEADERFHRVASIFIHPRLNATILDNDYAVLRMTTAVDFARNPHIRPICLINRTVRPGDAMTVIGWGQTNGRNNNQAMTRRLREATVYTVRQRECRMKYFWHVVTKNMVCAETRGGIGGSCFGDSGGPIMVNNAGSWELFGVTSYGKGCGRGALPGVYARAKPMRFWILSIIGSDCRQCPFNSATWPACV